MRYHWGCGISVEARLVHCIKPGSMTADAAAATSAEKVTLLRDVNKDDVDTDPFQVMKSSRTTKPL